MVGARLSADCQNASAPADCRRYLVLASWRGAPLAPRLLTSAWLTRRAPRCAGDTPLYRRTQRRGLRPSAARAPVLLAAHARAVLYAALKWCASPVANHSATHSAAAFQQLLHRCSALGPMLVSLSQLELHTAGDRRALGGARYETGLVFSQRGLAPRSSFRS